MPAKPKPFAVYLRHTFSKYIGTFTVPTKEDAINAASESDAYQNLRGVCHQCSRNLGDSSDGELIAEKE